MHARSPLDEILVRCDITNIAELSHYCIMCIQSNMTPLYRTQEGEDVCYAEELEEDGAVVDDTDEDKEHDDTEDEDEMEEG